jgi:hypothetical protein
MSLAISSVPSGRRPVAESGFHELRSARRAAGFAPPVATILRPFGTHLGCIKAIPKWMNDEEDSLAAHLAIRHQ